MGESDTQPCGGGGSFRPREENVEHKRVENEREREYDGVLGNLLWLWDLSAAGKIHNIFVQSDY